MSERRSVYRTQWTAQFAVASELCKREYQVALTMGNHPMVDIMVISPQGTPFLIDVKELYKKTYFPVRPRPSKDNLFYVFAFVPNEGVNRFYIMSQTQVNEEISKE